MGMLLPKASKRAAFVRISLKFATCSFALVMLIVAAPQAASAAPRSKAVFVFSKPDRVDFLDGLAVDPGEDGWWARDWSAADGAGFFGKPKPFLGSVGDGSRVVLRHTRYVTEYDASFLAPAWGAYTVDAATVASDLSGARTARNPDFKRPGTFYQEALVKSLSKRIGVRPASDATFTKAMDPRYPPSKAEGDAASIQRGHMVPNNAMKCQGAYEQGRVAQVESFSVANIVPQMAKSNSPSWASLESAVFDWANELDQVWVVVGPVFRDRRNPVFMEKYADGEKLSVPCPDELYCVVIGRRSGRISSIGFLMPHVPEDIDFRTKAEPVDMIERLTGLNFMPDLGEPNPIEASYVKVWLNTPARSVGSQVEE